MIPNCEVVVASEKSSRLAEILVWISLTVVGLAGLWLARTWSMGTVGNPGPGAFAAFILMSLTGLAVVRLVTLQLSSLSENPGYSLEVKQERRDHSVLLLLFAPLCFALLIGQTGFLLTGCAAGSMAAMAAGARRYTALGIAAVQTVLLYLLFRFGLSVPLDWAGGLFTGLWQR